jgi:hypothetical protein
MGEGNEPNIIMVMFTFARRLVCVDSINFVVDIFSCRNTPIAWKGCLKLALRGLNISLSFIDARDRDRDGLHIRLTLALAPSVVLGC